MKKLIFFLLLITISIKGVSQYKSNFYSIVFSSSGEMEAVNTEQYFRGIGKKRNLNLKISFNSNYSYFTNYYRPYFTKHLALINSLSDVTVQKDLIEFYHFSPGEIDLLLNDAKSTINNFPEGLKEKLGYPKLSYSVVDTAATSFSPYSISVTGYPVKSKFAPIFAHSDANPDIKNDIITYSINLNNDSTDIEKVNYKIVFNKPEAVKFNSSISSFTALKSHDEYLKISATLKAANELASQITDYIEIFNSKNPAVAGKLELFADTLRKYDDTISTYFCDQKEFVKSWLWYTGGKPKLNPFTDITTISENDKGNYIKEIDTIKRDTLLISAELSKLEKEFDLYKELIKANLKDKPTLAEADAITKKYENYLKSIGDLKLKKTITVEKLDSLNTEKKRFDNLKKKQDALAHESRVKDVYLYNGYVFPGNNHVITKARRRVAYRSYNAIDNMNAFRNLPYSYDDNTPVYLLTENDTMRRVIKTTFAPASDISTIAATFSPAIDELSVQKLLTSLNTLIENIEAKVSKSGFDSTVISEGTPSQQLNTIKKYSIRLKYFIDHLQSPPPIPASFVNDTTPRYFTGVYPVKYSAEDTSKIVRLEIPNGNKTVLDSFRVNKLYWVLPSVGLAYSNAKDPEVKLNGDGSIDKATYYNGLGLIIGVKIYPFGGAPIYDKHFVISGTRRPYIDYRKIHVMLGANAIHPLKQFYLGAGVDLWSGLSVNGGAHLINKVQQKVVNNKVESKNYLDWKNFYLSVNVDVSLAIKLINVLNR